MTDLQGAGRAFATSLSQRPYPGGAPFPDGFNADFAVLLGDLDDLGRQWFACSKDCGATFEAVFSTATDVWQIAVAVGSYDRVASPLSSRRHRIADGLLTAGGLPDQWRGSDLDLTTLQQSCDAGEDHPAGSTEAVDASLSDSTAHALARHSIVRFADPDAAAQYFNATRLRVALCRHRRIATDAESRSGLNLVTTRGLPSTAWSVSGRTPTAFTVATSRS